MNSSDVTVTLKDMWATRPARPRDGRKIAGVCIGLADQFGISVTLIRLAFILGFLFSVGVPFLLVYVALWLGMPDEGDIRPVAGYSRDDEVDRY